MRPCTLVSCLLLNPCKAEVGVSSTVASYHRTDRLERERAELFHSYDGDTTGKTAFLTRFDEVVVELTRDENHSIDRRAWLYDRIGEYRFEFRPWKEGIYG